jgi:hypothetical protein
VGPNSDLSKIIVFNPVLFGESDEAAQMKRRYQECFSPQFSSRIIFEPSDPPSGSELLRGSFAHFVQLLVEDAGRLMFFP